MAKLLDKLMNRWIYGKLVLEKEEKDNIKDIVKEVLGKNYPVPEHKFSNYSQESLGGGSFKHTIKVSFPYGYVPTELYGFDDNPETIFYTYMHNDSADGGVLYYNTEHGLTSFEINQSEESYMQFEWVDNKDFPTFEDFYEMCDIHVIYSISSWDNAL